MEPTGRIRSSAGWSYDTLRVAIETPVAKELKCHPSKLPFPTNRVGVVTERQVCNLVQLFDIDESEGNAY